MTARPLTRTDLRMRQASLDMTDDEAAAELGVSCRTYRAWIARVGASYAHRVPPWVSVMVCMIEFIRSRGLYGEWMAFRARHEGASWGGRCGDD